MVNEGGKERDAFFSFFDSTACSSLFFFFPLFTLTLFFDVDLYLDLFQTSEKKSSALNPTRSTSASSRCSCAARKKR